MTPTLKNIPDEVYGRLKVATEKHRCSLNSEAEVRDTASGELRQREECDR
jgi:plasmid stability protein